MMKQFNITEQLRKHFQHRSFQTGQKEIIQDILQKQDVLGVLPTGSGKSLCYQLPAKILSGTTIVVSPLISLMIDQVKQLKAHNFKSVIALNSFMTFQERNRVYQNLSRYRLIYVSPELLQQKSLLNHLKQLQVQLFVIDEAHCISQWGHEFRPDYLRLVNVIDELNNPPILALTATASPQIQQDILTVLKRPNMKKHIYPIDRPNIAFYVEKVSDDQKKLNYILRLLLEYRVPTLIYFSSRRMTEEVAIEIANQLKDVRVSHYHGGMDPIDRTMVQQQFMTDQLDVICCTSAFGMGIDKKNIRLIVHYHFPSELESYIQEVGRSGRDGKKSVGLVLYSPSDQNLQEYLIQGEYPEINQLKNVLHYLASVGKETTQLQQVEQQLLQMVDNRETHWRFLRYQFEIHGIIKEELIIYDKLLYENAYLQISNHIDQRRQTKRKKLIAMLNWLQEETCLRRHLYQSFQSSYEKTTNCCNLCGFTLSNWYPEQLEVTESQRMEATWEQKLQKLFFIGAYDESRTINQKNTT